MFSMKVEMLKDEVVQASVDYLKVSSALFKVLMEYYEAVRADGGSVTSEVLQVITKGQENAEILTGILYSVTGYTGQPKPDA